MSALDTIRDNTRKQLYATVSYEEAAAEAYRQGAEAMRQRCADHLRQRAQEESQRKRMITSAACSWLTQEVEAMDIAVPERAENF